MVLHKRPVKAAEEIEEQLIPQEEVVEETPVEEPVVEVAEDATDLLFEAEDVAELIAEVTGQPVEVTADENSVEFAIGNDVYTVEAEGDEEVLESVRKPMAGKKAVTATTKRTAKK